MHELKWKVIVVVVFFIKPKKYIYNMFFALVIFSKILFCINKMPIELTYPRKIQCKCYHFFGVFQ